MVAVTFPVTLSVLPLNVKLLSTFPVNKGLSHVIIPLFVVPTNGRNPDVPDVPLTPDVPDVPAPDVPEVPLRPDVPDEPK